ncbi:MAG: FHA domain-containing protein [Gammaproteobacteria bacterium]|nr:FHA domain-containing protein [Gammaproteobacteria bacterium]
MSKKNKNKTTRPDPDIADAGGDDVTATFEALDLDSIESKAKANGHDVATERGHEGPAEHDAPEPHSFDRKSDVPTIRSLGRLEEDLMRLQQSWADVEQQLSAKDSEIAYLNDEREVHIAAFRSLQSDLDEQLDENDRNLEQIASLEERMREMESRLEDHNQIVAGRDVEIDQLKAAVADEQQRYEVLHSERDRLKDDVAEAVAERQKALDNSKRIEQELLNKKTDMLDLESYIDRRKGEWDQLTAKLDDAKAAIAGMQSELELRERTISQHDEVAGVLHSKIDELKQQCAELDGRRAERELANKELNQLLSEKTTELEALRKERDDATEGSKVMVTRIQDQQIRISSLEQEVSELSGRIKQIRKTADDEVEQAQRRAREEVADYAKRLEAAEADADRRAQAADHAEKRAADAELELKRNDDAMEMLRDVNKQLENRLIDESSRVSEISDELSRAHADKIRLQTEYDSFQNDTEQRLEANAELIAKLESELDMRNAAIEALEKNADKLGAINADIQKLDRLIVEGVQSSERRLSTMTGRTLTLAVEGMPHIKFPIYKSCMTIGRGSDTDIQLRRKFISRRHARLTEDADGVRIEDLGSKNGVYVNEQAVTDSYLHDGDIVDIGEVKLKFVEEEQAA